ncbi:ALQxL family class IV lanthipeptide [Streptosporangium amethystogenes subsp. fukuiense]|uniref:ALQxL family class IV lanthipeptide n=1 Tax=Streptosporangium amethystogenes subsp. fukuiense TaxID=698418 RepID=A0ABW2TEQ0_9ACTN
MELDVQALDMLPAQESRLYPCEITCLKRSCITLITCLNTNGF